jgi:hypothetical protein
VSPYKIKTQVSYSQNTWHRENISKERNGGIEKKDQSLAWWYILVIPALGRLRQKDCEFKASWTT